MINDRAEKKTNSNDGKGFVKLEKIMNNTKLYCLRIELDFVFEEEQHLLKR